MSSRTRLPALRCSRPPRWVPTLQTTTPRLGPKSVPVPWVGGGFSHCAPESLRFVQMKNKIRAKGENAILKIENKLKQKNLIMYWVDDKALGRKALFPET